MRWIEVDILAIAAWCGITVAKQSLPQILALEPGGFDEKLLCKGLEEAEGPLASYLSGLKSSRRDRVLRQGLSLVDMVRISWCQLLSEGHAAAAEKPAPVKEEPATKAETSI